MVLTFITMLRVHSKESKSSRLHRPRVWLHTSHNAASTKVALERGCSIATIRAETSDWPVMTRYACIKAA
jgi:hypothetical protein